MKQRNLDFLNEISSYRKESLLDMKKYLHSMDWANKTSPVKEIKYEEDDDELEQPDESKDNNKQVDELDWELKKFEEEKEEYKKKY